MDSVSCKLGIEVTKWQSKNEENPFEEKIFPRSLFYIFLPSFLALIALFRRSDER